ncbi:germinal-center associated nuclear protein-like [Macrobrachium nipponense]|uniref:germinal-center associated nuclear protein-like n=1 Tax=Macrobrachium nipponense TaxID=159736 RepID=UPI0030C8037F
MANKDGKSGDKPTFTNPFLLPSSSAARQRTAASESSNIPRPFGTVTSGPFVSSGNTVSCSADVFTTSSRKQSVSSLPSSTFPTSSFKTFEPGASFINVSSRPSGMFGADGGLSKSGTYTFPVFGGEKKEKGIASDGGFRKVSAEARHEFGMSGKAISSNLGFGAFSSGQRSDYQRSDSQHHLDKTSSKLFDSALKRGTQSKSVPLVFGEISSGTGSQNIPLCGNVTSVSSPPTNVFGGVADSGVSKSEKSAEISSKKLNVFGGTPSTCLFHSSFTGSGSLGTPGMFTTSGNAPSSAFTLFRNSGSASGTPATGAPAIFGGASATSSSSITSHSGYNAAPVPSIFGGKVEGTKRGGSVVTSTPNVFGSITGSTSCVTSVSSTIPRLFGGIPSSALVSEVSCGDVKPSVSSIASVPKLSVEADTSLPPAPIFKLPSNTSENITISSETKSDTPPVPSLFGGTIASETSSMPVATVSNSSSKTSQMIHACEPSKSQDQSALSGISKTYDVTSKDKPSSSKALFTPPASIFGGVKNSKETDSSSQQTFCNKPDSQTLIPEFTSRGSSKETGLTPGQPDSATMDPKTEEQAIDSKDLEPGEIIEASSLENEPSVTEIGSSDVDRGKQLDDLLDIFGKEDDPKLTASATMVSPPQYEKKDLTKIIIAQIPDSCMDKDIIKTHFQKFGKVKRVFLNQKSNQATVQYEDHKGASRAKRKGQKIHPNLPEVKIFYATPVRRKSEDNSNDAILSKKKAIKTLKQTHPVGDSKAVGDLDPYIPLERPTLGTPSSQPVPPLFTPGKYSKISKVFAEEKKSVKVPGQPSTEIRPRTMSPQAAPRIGSPKITRMDSPKSAKLKVEEKLKTLSRPVSPAREYDVFTEIKNLKAALELQALTSNDRFTVLKARDKLMRNERKKRLDIKKAASLDAGCPDMCPEHERYMRDVQNDLSSYEVTNGVLDHKLVVKKFSRSSADKEEPLPHELRPGPVLLKTMDFLVCNIMVLCDKENTDIGVWYNYLWDRTRAIRSDITQQQLTDNVAVTIIERCVRFHIYAAVHLCEESPDVFDRKLNTENLTKSLQTLKELYKDLAEMKKFFPSEAEFRAYEMLLNLNDGEKIVYQYSQYRDEVQKSSDVKFALKVFLALKSNNFVKFFKLIRSGTYLQGCILHRYFPQVRSKALDIFVKAYVISKRVSIPLPYIIKTLGFEDRTDAVGYLNYHGITVDKENVVIAKNLIDLHPEGQPPVTRPVKLIESNRLFTVVEVIQGGPMPENPLQSYVPHDSFDENGYLNPDARDATDQQKKLKSLLLGHAQSAVPKESVLMPTIEEAPVEMPQVPGILDSSESFSTCEHDAISDHDYITFITDAYSMITTSVVSELSVVIAKDSIENVTQEKLQKMAAKGLINDIVVEYIKEEIKMIAKTSYDEVHLETKEKERKEIEEAEKKRKEEEELHYVVTVLLCKEYMADLLPGLIKEVCEESVFEVENELLEKVHAVLVKELPSSLVSEVVHEEVRKVATKVISEMSKELEDKIGKLQQKITLRKVRESFRKWRKVVLRIRRRKQAQVTFPALSSQLDIREQNKAFSWGYKRKLNENVSVDHLMKRKLASAEMSQKTLIRNQLERSVAWFPLSLEREMRRVVEKYNRINNIIKHYFKILICNCSDSDFTLMQWLRSKLSGSENADINVELNHTLSFLSTLTGQEYGFVFQEVSSNCLPEVVNSGTSAMLFVTHGLTTQDPDYARVKSWIKANSDVPYKVMCEGSPFGEDCWVLSENDVLFPETSEKLMNLIIDLWSSHAGRMQVSLSRLDSLILGYVATYYIQPSVLKQHERSMDKKSPLSPMTYIDLYNSAIQFLVEVFTDDKLSALDWPPPELRCLDQVPPPSWNNEDMKLISSTVQQLKLPEFRLDGFMPWEQLVKALHLYVVQISQPESFSHVLWSQVNGLLTKTQEFLKSLYRLDFESSDAEIHVLHLPWTELIHTCVSFKLSTLPSLPVFYQPQLLRSFVFPKGWWDACDYSDPLWDNICYETLHKNSRKRKDEEDINPKNSKIPSLSSELMSDIMKEKEKYLEFEKRLEGALESPELVVEDLDKRDRLEFDDCDYEEDSGPEEEFVPYSELSSRIAQEKEKCKLFQKKLESILGDGEDLCFLFKE